MNVERDRGTTHFGYRDVAEDEKASLVGEVFSSVAGKYDVMNDVMSFGVHRLWKRFAASQSGLREGQAVLDVAAGRVYMTDINADMLMRGRDVMIDHGAVDNIRYCITDAENLSFADNLFDCVSIAFGLRNVTRIPKALREMYRVVKPGGRVLILEFSRPVSPLFRKAYDAYSFGVIPGIGKLIAGDAESYRYLVQSIRKHPDQETLVSMMGEVGFDRVEYHNLTGGVVALHIGFKF